MRGLTQTTPRLFPMIVLMNQEKCQELPSNRRARDTESSTPREADRLWNDSPLRSKIVLLIILATLGGGCIGQLGASLDLRVWPFWVGLAGLLCALIGLGKYWVWLPFEQLMKQVDRLGRKELPASFRPLPVCREDEVGRLAQVINKLAVRSVQERRETNRLRRTLDQGVEQATRRATRQLRQMAMHDPLTSLGNRRFLEENFESLVDSAWSSGTDLVCVVIDMDNFKSVNDSLGHAAGDELLVFLAQLIRGSIRHEDYAVRLGGDEFVILLPACDVSRVEELLKQIVILFSQHVRAVMPKGVHAGLSVGIASLTDGINTGRELLDAADANLYMAKRSGKGCVVTV